MYESESQANLSFAHLVRVGLLPLLKSAQSLKPELSSDFCMLNVTLQQKYMYIRNLFHLL